MKIPKITTCYYEYHPELERFEVRCETDDNKEAALSGTMCAGFFFALMKVVIKHKAVIIQKITLEESKEKRIYKPSLQYFRKQFEKL